MVSSILGRSSMFSHVFFPVLPVLPVVWHTYLLRSPPLKGKVDSHKGMSKTASKCLKSWNSRKPLGIWTSTWAMEVFRLVVLPPPKLNDVNAPEWWHAGRRFNGSASYWVKRFGRFGVFFSARGMLRMLERDNFFLGLFHSIWSVSTINVKSFW